MKIAIRILLIVVAAELAASGYAAARHWQREVPVLPAANIEDPVFAADLQRLAEATSSGDAAAWQELADALLGYGFYAEAELNYRQAIRRDPANHAALFGLALCLDRTGRIEASNTAYRQAAKMPAKKEELISTSRHARYAIGKNYLRLQEAEQAEAEFRANSGFGPADYQLAKLLVRSGRAAEALPIIDANLERTPESLWFHFIKYRAMQELGRETEAEAMADGLQRSRYVVPLNFNTDFVEPLSNRYGINRLSEDYNRLLKKGDMDAVARQLELMLETVGERPLPERVVWLTRLAEVELQRGNLTRVHTLLEQVKSLGEENADLLQLEGAALARAGQPKAAVALWLRAANLSPNIPLDFKLAQYYESIGDTTARDRHLGQQALMIAKMSWWNNQYPDALKAAERATALIPDNAQGWFYLGEVQRHLGKRDEAITAYQTCLERNPEHGRAMHQLKLLEAM